MNVYLVQLLALIGDQFFDESQYVNGLWVNVRPKNDKIALWTRCADNQEVQMKIGYVFNAKEQHNKVPSK